MHLRGLRFGSLGWMLGLVASCASNNTDDGLGGGDTTSAGGASTDTSSSSPASGVTSASATSGLASSTTSNASAVSSSSTGPNLCGNGVIDAGEFCDGEDFGGKTCADFGLAQGELDCNTFCGIVVAGCTPFESCADEQDNDNDGDVDCDDSECAGQTICTDACASPHVAVVPTNDSGQLIGKPDLLQNTCGAIAGPEVVWRVTAPMDGNLAVRFFADSGRGSVALRTSCADASTEYACATTQAGNSAVLSRPVVAGQTIFVVFEDNSNGQPSSYNFDIEMPPPEHSCNDLFDDDHDGFVDCDDPDACQTLAECEPQANARPYGAQCFDHNLCQSGTTDPVCLRTPQGFSNGYCSEFCDLAADDCAGDGVCVPSGLSPIHGVCMDGCQTDLDCGQGLGCVDSGPPGSRKICANPPELACNDNDDNDGDGLRDCEDKTACAQSPQCAPGPNAAGTPCQIHNQCTADDNDPFCLDQFNFGWPGGYCSEFCDLASPDCPADSACVPAPFNPPSNSGLCLHTCVDDADCRAGYSCIDEGAFSVCRF